MSNEALYHNLNRTMINCEAYKEVLEDIKRCIETCDTTEERVPKMDYLTEDEKNRKSAILLKEKFMLESILENLINHPEDYI